MTLVLLGHLEGAGALPGEMGLMLPLLMELSELTGVSEQ